MKIAVITFRKFTMLEYLAPALWALRATHPEATLRCYYCAGNKQVIFNKGTFLELLINEWDIKQPIFFPPAKSKLRTIWRNVIDLMRQTQIRHRVNLREMARNILERLYYKDYAKVASEHLLAQLGPKQRLLNPHQAEVDRFIMELETYAPDLILIDHKWSFYAWPALAAFFDYVAAHQVKVLVPPEGCFRGLLYPFSDALPEELRPKFEYWLPYRDNSVFREKTDGRTDSYYLSAPSLDSAWTEYLCSRQAQAPTPAGPVRCMYIIRKFLPPGSDTTKRELADLTYDQFLETTRVVLDGLKKLGSIELIVKPYPTMTEAEVARAFNDLSFSAYTISFESIYAYVGKIDFLVSELTSSSFPMLVVPTPVLLLEHSIFSELDAVYPEYDPIRKIFPLRTEREKDFRVSFNEQIDIYLDKERLARRMQESQAYLRQYYPDGGCAQFVNRIETLEEELKAKHDSNSSFSAGHHSASL